VFNLRRFDHVPNLTYNIVDLKLNTWIDLRTFMLFYKIVTTGEPTYRSNKVTSQRTKNYISLRIQTLCSKRPFFVMVLGHGTIFPINTKQLGAQLNFIIKLTLYYMSIEIIKENIF